MGEIRSMRKYCTVACWCSLYTGMGGVELKNKSILRNYIFLTKKTVKKILYFLNLLCSIKVFLVSTDRHLVKRS